MGALKNYIGRAGSVIVMKSMEGFSSSQAKFETESRGCTAPDTYTVRIVMCLYLIIAKNRMMVMMTTTTREKEILPPPVKRRE